MEVLMARSKSIRVTPNMEKCLKILIKTVKSMPKGDLKDQSKAALDYMSQTFKGTPQPNRGRKCRPPLLIIPD